MWSHRAATPIVTRGGDPFGSSSRRPFSLGVPPTKEALGA